MFEPARASDEDAYPIDRISLSWQVAGRRTTEPPRGDGLKGLGDRECREDQGPLRAQAEAELRSYVERRQREVDRLVEAARRERRRASGGTPTG